MSNNIRHMKASAAYSAVMADLLAVVKNLESAVTEFTVDAHSAHWGNIGDAQRALEMAQQLRALLCNTDGEVAA